MYDNCGVMYVCVGMYVMHARVYVCMYACRVFRCVLRHACMCVMYVCMYVMYVSI